MFCPRRLSLKRLDMSSDMSSQAVENETTECEIDLDELLPDLLLPELHLHAPLIELLTTPSDPRNHAVRAVTVGLVLLQPPSPRSSCGPLVLREVQPFLGALHAFNSRPDDHLSDMLLHCWSRVVYQASLTFV